MGIPAFFSYIIKNHPEIIKQIGGNNLFHNFYLDSNSIIYDCLRNIEFDANTVNEKYLSTKRDKLGHLIMENLDK